MLNSVKEIVVKPEDRTVRSAIPSGVAPAKPKPVPAAVQSPIKFWMKLSTYTLIWVLVNGLVALAIFGIGVKLLMWSLAYAKTTPSLIDYATWLYSQRAAMMTAGVELSDATGYWRAIGHVLLASITISFTAPIILTGLEGFVFVGKGLISLSRKSG